MLGAASNRENIRAVFYVRCCVKDRGHERAVIDRRRCLAHNPIRFLCGLIVLFRGSIVTGLRRWALQPPTGGTLAGARLGGRGIRSRFAAFAGGIAADRNRLIGSTGLFRSGAFWRPPPVAQSQPAAPVGRFRKPLQAAQTGWRFGCRGSDARRGRLG